MLHAWRGGFLNTTEMWHERGEEQVGAPLGMDVPLSGRFSLTAKDKLEAIPESTLRYEGMKIEDIKGQKTPQFSYVYQNITIKDWTQPTADKLGLKRNLTFSATPTNLNVLLAATTMAIQKVSDDLYSVDDAAYFIRLPAGTSVVLSQKDGKNVLMAEPKTTSFSYDIVF